MNRPNLKVWDVNRNKEELEDIALLRQVLARELDTISQYEESSFRAHDEKVRLFFLHLAREEKEHVSEAMALLHEYDKDQELEWAKANTSTDHFLERREVAPTLLLAKEEGESSHDEIPVSAETQPTPEGEGTGRVFSKPGLALTVGSLISWKVD